MSPSRSARGAVSTDTAAPFAGHEIGVIDTAKALVVGNSPVNRVVISRIVEKSGLRPISEDPEAALKTLDAQLPGIVLLDGGADNRDCDLLMPSLVALRQRFGARAPRVILLSVRIVSGEGISELPVVDAVVAKPITPEVLQPVLNRLLDGLRG